MSFTPLAAMVRKDLRLFFTDRRAVIMGFIAPIAIASFFGSIFSGASGSGEAAKIPIAIVDQDASPISAGVLSRARADPSFVVAAPTVDVARDAVRRGRATVALILPAGFGDAAGRAFLSGQSRPEIMIWYDPSHGMELALVRGVMTRHIMEAVSAEVFGGASGRKIVDDVLQGVDGSTLPADQKVLLKNLLNSVQRFNAADAGGRAGGGPARGITIPYVVKEEAVTSGENRAYNGYAHSFAGMSIQFLFFAMIDLGVGILLERERGLWKRLRSAPVSRLALLGGKALSGSLIATLSLLVSFGFAIVVFGVHIHGSVVGFVLVVAACALMAATFGLMLASLGRTAGATRGVASLAVLMMVMLGGAWVPTFIFPAWLQRLTVIVPARWAVDGLDAMTWRGLGLQSAILPTVVLVGFAAIFGALALRQFRWDE